MKNRFKKLALLCASLLTAIPAFAATPAVIAGATVGAVAGAAIITAVAVKTHRRHERERNGEQYTECSKCHKKVKVEHVNKERHCSSCSKNMNSSSSKSERRMQNDLKNKESERDRHARKLEKLEKQGKADGVRARHHRSELQRIEADINNLKMRIENAF